MEIKENIPLAPYTTLRIGGPAKYFIEVTNEQELNEGLAFAKARPSFAKGSPLGELPVFILGGGSNVLFADKGFDGLVIRPLIKGRNVQPASRWTTPNNEILVEVGAGEVLDDVIAWTVENDWWGMENLSFIPGLIGAMVIQNVGAYGQEASEVIESVEVMDILTLETKIISNKECKFDYRKSRFNTRDKNKFVILNVTFKLRKIGKPNISYKDLQGYFGDKMPKQKEVRGAVIKIRTDKGQDPNEIWSAGSFFKNFVVSDEEGNRYKISAAQVLDKTLNLKGFQVGGAKLSEQQVLNVVNTGKATARDCIELFEKVRDLVGEKTGLTLINEPEFVGF